MQPYVINDGLFPMKRMNPQETASLTAGGWRFVLAGHGTWINQNFGTARIGWPFLPFYAACVTWWRRSRRGPCFTLQLFILKSVITNRNET
jgi:hypothetical protein